MNASYSSKKDSKATSDSKYSVEYTMDVAVKAGQDSMPAGLSKILELLATHWMFPSCRYTGSEQQLAAY